MPFESKAQRKFMYAKHPEIAKEFESKTGDKQLPERKAEKSALKRMAKKNAKDDYGFTQ